MKEKLSAFLDNELDPQEQEALLKEMYSNPELRRLWERYHFSQSVIRNELEGIVLPGLADKIAKRIQDEPTVLVPRWSGLSSGRMTKLVGSLAIAASVAAISIISLQPSGVKLDSEPQIIANEANNSNNNYIRAGVTRWNKRQPELESTLNMYLVEHNEVNPASSFKGMMSYGRVLGYDNEKRKPE